MAGEAQYHFLVLAPGLQSAWFFQAARQYWQRFQPIVSDNLALLSYLPATASVTVTVLARPDTADYMKRQIEAQRSGVTLDMVVESDLPAMELKLNTRAQSGQPFGQEVAHP